MYGFDERLSSLVRFDQHASKQSGVAKRCIGARASSGCHRMDGVTEQSDIRTRPRRQRDRGPHLDIADRRRLRHADQSTQMRMPVPSELQPQLSQLFAAQVARIPRAILPSAPYAPADAVLVECLDEIRPTSSDTRVASAVDELERVNDCAEAHRCHNQRHAFEHFVRQQSFRLDRHRNFAPERYDSGVFQTRFRQALPAYRGVRAVSAHQHISRREASILKAGGDRPVGVI